MAPFGAQELRSGRPQINTRRDAASRPACETDQPPPAGSRRAGSATEGAHILGNFGDSATVAVGCDTNIEGWIADHDRGSEMDESQRGGVGGGAAGSWALGVTGPAGGR